jgi:hypothetical protein
MRLTDEAERVALSYGDSVSKGILAMKWKIEMLQSATTAKTDELYWKTFDEHLSRIELPKFGGTIKVNEFKPASTLPRIKEIGKILPEERLEEPVGRQGRGL